MKEGILPKRVKNDLFLDPEKEEERE